MTESIAVSEIFASKGRFGKDGIIKRIVPKLKKQWKIPNLLTFNKKDSTETKKTIKDSDVIGIWWNLNRLIKLSSCLLPVLEFFFGYFKAPRQLTSNAWIEPVCQLWYKRGANTRCSVLDWYTLTRYTLHHRGRHEECLLSRLYSYTHECCKFCIFLQHYFIRITPHSL